MECFIGINWFSIEMMYIQFDRKEICNLYTICLYRVTDMSSLDKQQSLVLQQWSEGLMGFKVEGNVQLMMECPNVKTVWPVSDESWRWWDAMTVTLEFLGMPQDTDFQLCSLVNAAVI